MIATVKLVPDDLNHIIIAQWKELNTEFLYLVDVEICGHIWYLEWMWEYLSTSILPLSKNRLYSTLYCSSNTGFDE